MKEKTEGYQPQVDHSRTIAMPPRKDILRNMAERFSIDPNKLTATLKATAFKQKKDQDITDEQLMALVVVAEQYQLNPWTKEIYAFPDKGGIVPIVGVDGWTRITNAQPEFDGMEFAQSDNIITLEEAKSCPEWIECVIYRKDRSHPIRVREYLDECYRPPFIDQRSNYVTKGPWQTHTKRMLRHKAMIQAARIAFGFVGIYDQDEGMRILDGEAEVVPVDDTQASADTLNAEFSAQQPPEPPAAENTDPAPQGTVDDFFADDSGAETDGMPALDVALESIAHADTLEALKAVTLQPAFRALNEPEKKMARARYAGRAKQLKAEAS